MIKPNPQTNEMKTREEYENHVLTSSSNIMVVMVVLLLIFFIHKIQLLLMDDVINVGVGYILMI
jgi:hypothetical protein